MLHWHSNDQGGGGGALPGSQVHLVPQICPSESKPYESAPGNASEKRYITWLSGAPMLQICPSESKPYGSIPKSAPESAPENTGALKVKTTLKCTQSAPENANTLPGSQVHLCCKSDLRYRNALEMHLKMQLIMKRGVNY